MNPVTLNIYSVYLNETAIGFKVAREHFHDGSLASSIVTEQAYNLPLSNLKGYGIYGLKGAIVPRYTLYSYQNKPPLVLWKKEQNRDEHLRNTPALRSLSNLERKTKICLIVLSNTLTDDIGYNNHHLKITKIVDS
jgi:hypothetical protein